MHLSALFAQWVTKRHQACNLNAVSSSLKDSWGVILCIFNFNIEWRKPSVSRPGRLTPHCLQVPALWPWALCCMTCTVLTVSLTCVILATCPAHLTGLHVIVPTKTCMPCSKNDHATFCVIFYSHLLHPSCKVLQSVAFTDSLSKHAVCVSRLNLRHQLLSVLLWFTYAWQ